MSEEVKKIKEKYERQLLDVKGVVGVGFNGSVVVYVEKLTPQVASFIPRTLDGISVHIIETGKVKLLSFPIVEASYQSRAERVRPLIGGISVGHPEATAGTLSCGVRDKASGRILGLSNNHVCFDKETEILTEDGWIFFEKLESSDKVATLNSEGAIEYQYPVEIQKVAYNGDMVRFKSQFFDLLVTPEHRLYVWYRKYNGRPRSARHGKYLGEKQYGWIIAKEFLDKSPRRSSPIGFTKKSTWNCEVINTVKIPDIEEPINMTTWMKFLGWYLAEGSYTYTKDGKFIVAIRNTNMNNLIEIADLVEDMKLRPWVSPMSGQVQVSSKQLYDYVEPLGRSGDKFIPKELKQLEPDLLFDLFWTYIKGDGTTIQNPNSSYQIAITKSKRLADDIQEIVIKLGGTATIEEFISQSEWSTGSIYYKVRVFWQWLEPEIKREHVSTEKYSDYVYDCTVPNDRILVRRNGIPLWSCNCALDWGEVAIGKKGDPILQPGIYDSGTITDKIGELERWLRVEGDRSNLIDAALFTVGEIDGIDEVGKQSNTVDPYVGMGVKKSGRTSGLTFGKVIDVNASFNVEGYGEAVFKDQVVVSPHFSLPGDSGSWVGDENDRTVGLVFAGSTEVTIINKATNIESILGIEFAPELPYIPLWAAMIPIPALLIGAVAIKGGNKK